jgi:hypothetical protein
VTHSAIFEGPDTCLHAPEEHGTSGCVQTLDDRSPCPCTAHWVTDKPVMAPVRVSRRHAATQEKLRWLVPNPALPAGPPSDVAQLFYDAALALLHHCHDGPQLTIALQRLIDSKDAAVRQAVADSQ